MLISEIRSTHIHDWGGPRGDGAAAIYVDFILGMRQKKAAVSSNEVKGGRRIVDDILERGAGGP